MDELRLQWGVAIREAREARGLTQAALGLSCGVNQSTVAKWEQGRIAPTEANKIRVAAVLGAEARTMFPLALAAAGR